MVSFHSDQSVSFAGKRLGVWKVEEKHSARICSCRVELCKHGHAICEGVSGLGDDETMAAKSTGAQSQGQTSVWLDKEKDKDSSAAGWLR